MAGVKLWAPPSFVKFGCLVHDVQLSSSARLTCHMVALSSSQVALFVMSVAASDTSIVVMPHCWPATCKLFREPIAFGVQSARASQQDAGKLLYIFVLLSVSLFCFIFIFSLAIAFSFSFSCSDGGSDSRSGSSGRRRRAGRPWVVGGQAIVWRQR